MIKVRTNDGEVLEFKKEGTFIEICDSSDNPAVVFFKGPKSITQITGDSEEAKMYEAKFNCKFAQLINLKDRYEDD
tara:strand:- start:231 stop:458 length:228 start_codon:yes stop_codon:yes gene_type:complete